MNQIPELDPDKPDEESQQMKVAKETFNEVEQAIEKLFVGRTDVPAAEIYDAILALQLGGSRVH